MPLDVAPEFALGVDFVVLILIAMAAMVLGFALWRYFKKRG